MEKTYDVTFRIRKRGETGARPMTRHQAITAVSRREAFTKATTLAQSPAFSSLQDTVTVRWSDVRLPKEKEETVPDDTLFRRLLARYGSLARATNAFVRIRKVEADTAWITRCGIRKDDLAAIAGEVFGKAGGDPLKALGILRELCTATPLEKERLIARYDLQTCRVCSSCGKLMHKGFCVDDGCEYFCTEACLRRVYGPEAQQVLDEAGTEGAVAYWTVWEG